MLVCMQNEATQHKIRPGKAMEGKARQGEASLGREGRAKVVKGLKYKFDVL